MSEAGKGTVVIDIASLRRSCASCSLQQLCLPASIGGEDLDRIDRLVNRRRPIRSGEHLFRQGETMNALFVARDGAFKTVAVNSEGDSQVLGFHLPGELMGFDALGSGEHQCDAEALGPALVCELPFDQIERLAGEVPGLHRQLLRVIGRSMERDQAHLEMLGRRHASERVALFLHSLSERFEKLGRRGDRFGLPMSREDIGGYLGLAIETVSRTLSKLQDEGLIAVRGRELRILDVKRLNALAHVGDPRRADSA